MNFKRKLWWAQHRTDVYKYGTILSLVLIVTISIIYFTYSKFTSTNEGLVMETTVEPFIKNDYFIASYIDGAWSNEIPGKDDGYAVDKVVCDNGAVGTWDNDEWGINIRNAMQKVKCGVYFYKLTTAKQIEAIASADITNISTDDPDDNTRYIGKDPNNYVYFNCSDYLNQSDSTCEKWRIIGVFKNVTKEDGTKEDLVKIIKEDIIKQDSIIDNGYVRLDRSANDWSKASLQTTLNGTYYNGTYSTTAFKNDSTRNAIESVVWNLGGTADYQSSNNGLASHFYSYERGTTVYIGRPTTWIGKVGLMYPSDYGYATAGGSTTDRATCLAKEMYSWSSASDCYSNDYLYKSSYWQWTLTPNSSDSTHEFVVSMKDGSVYAESVNAPVTARPVVYLKSSILILTGDGTSSNPYRLSVN